MARPRVPECLKGEPQKLTWAPPEGTVLNQRTSAAAPRDWAPSKMEWVCGACHRRSRRKSEATIRDSKGWRLSCARRSFLVHEDTVRVNGRGRVTYADVVTREELENMPR